MPHDRDQPGDWTAVIRNFDTHGTVLHSIQQGTGVLVSAYYLMGIAVYDLTGRALGESSPV